MFLLNTISGRLLGVMSFGLSIAKQVLSCLCGWQHKNQFLTVGVTVTYLKCLTPSSGQPKYLM